jgi:hypothetical protein
MTDGQVGEPAPLLPDTTRLLEGLERLASADGLDGFSNPLPGRIASYCAVPEPNLPNRRFHITEANPKFLNFVGKTAPGFEALEVFRAGFQYHWRRDLVRTFDEQLPLVGRLCWLFDTRELVIEHLSLPVLRKGRVREIRGWLVFGQDLAPGGASMHLEDIGMFRRIERSRVLQSLATLTRPGAENTKVREFWRGVRGRWGAGGKQHRPC